MKITRFLVLACFAVSAVAAHAFTIDLVSAGKVTAGATVDYDETVLLQVTSMPLPAFTDVAYSIVNGSAPEPGAGTFSNVGGDLLGYDLFLDSVSFGPTVVSGSGTWVYTGGAGAYANLVGQGTFAFTINENTNASYSSFSGNLDAVPEPASIALLGMGALALLRRAKKSS